MMLADHGAEVIKIEPPDGDPARSFAPYLPGMTDFGGYFQSINRNKLSVVLDLKSAEGNSAFMDLVRSAHVVVENFRAGVMSRLGLDYETLALENPALVYCAIRGFGDPRTGASPYAHWPAFDVVAQSMGGLISVTGKSVGDVLKVGPGIGDIVPAMFAAFGIMAAVHEARISGRGQFVDVGMVDAILALTERIVHQYSYLGEIPKPEGNRHPIFAPFGIFPASDGHVAVACPTDHFWRDLARLLERPELADDGRCATNAARSANADFVCEVIGSWTATRTKAALADLLGGVVPFGPVNDAADIAVDPHIRARGMLVSCEQPGLDRTVEIVGTPVKMTRSIPHRTVRAPKLGEHTEKVLKRLVSVGPIDPQKRIVVEGD
jgi:crotonobetainyl-CoA:carnitine CoA-transferase CaiB-like acyl-CoA transferase